MREAGLHHVNPSSAELLALIDAGATPLEFADLARELALSHPGKPMQYLLAVMRNRRAAAAQPPVYGGYRPAMREPETHAGAAASRNGTPGGGGAVHARPGESSHAALHPSAARSE